MILLRTCSLASAMMPDAADEALTSAAPPAIGNIALCACRQLLLRKWWHVELSTDCL